MGIVSKPMMHCFNDYIYVICKLIVRFGGELKVLQSDVINIMEGPHFVRKEMDGLQPTSWPLVITTSGVYQIDIF